ncbi:hypothetical protein JNJ66_04975 [Candidatus Saccharibacteria bacterium]|nr:hypothetical protein [Candidatus Saccharibacteria bacterium]
MGLFEGLKRMIQGKPVFTVEDGADDGWKDSGGNDIVNPSGYDPYKPDSVKANVNRDGTKILPQVIVERIDCNLSGNRMDCYFNVQNNSPVEVELDKITILGTTEHLDRPLQPGEEHECLVFSGERPDNNYANKCQIYYKDKTGDYFMTEHYIDFQKEHDGTYYIYRVTFMKPVRDV